MQPNTYTHNTHRRRRTFGSVTFACGFSTSFAEAFAALVEGALSLVCRSERSAPELGARRRAAERDTKSKRKAERPSSEEANAAAASLLRDRG